MKKLILSFVFLLFTYPVFGLSEEEFLRDVFVLTNHILVLEHDMDDFMRAFQNENQRSNDEMASELIFICDALKGREDSIMRTERIFAFESFMDYPTTNAVPFLMKTFKTEQDTFGTVAMCSYLQISDYSDEALMNVDDFLDTHPRNEKEYLGEVYGSVSFVLHYKNPDEKKRHRLLIYLQKRREKGDQYMEWIDQILREQDCDYSRSPERRFWLKSVSTNTAYSADQCAWASNALEEIARTLEPKDEPQDLMGVIPVSVSNTVSAEVVSNEINQMEEVSPAKDDKDRQRNDERSESGITRRRVVGLLLLAGLLSLWACGQKIKRKHGTIRQRQSV